MLYSNQSQTCVFVLTAKNTKLIKAKDRTMNIKSSIIKLPITALAAMTIALGGCSNEEEQAGFSRAVPDLRIVMPDSMTGGQNNTLTKSTFKNQRAGSSGEPCFYTGEGEEDLFKNGYTMSRMMISAVATWSCVADTVIEIASFIPHDGIIHETDNDRDASNYDPDESTHYSITDDSDNQITVRIYHGYSRSDPPTTESHPDIFISWLELEDGEVQGRLVIDGLGVNSDKEIDPEEPTDMRMDFTLNEETRSADMYLKFANNDELINGFRIQVSEDLTANPLTQVFTAKGMLDLKQQYIPDTGLTETPVLQMFAVANQLGEGATVADFVDVAVSLELNAELNNHLGTYLFTKKDKYFFDADQSTNEPWDYINKTVTSSEYRGDRTTALTGGTWIPVFNPSQDLLIIALQLDSDYFTGTKCNNIGDDCNPLLNAIFEDGFADQEMNQGTDPLDWRTNALTTAEYLDSIYPTGFSDWNGVFEPVFNP